VAIPINGVREFIKVRLQTLNLALTDARLFDLSRIVTSFAREVRPWQAAIGEEGAGLLLGGYRSQFSRRMAIYESPQSSAPTGALNYYLLT
jgi:hypothetical protein